MALRHAAFSNDVVGMATPQQFEDALAAVQKGPLPSAALDRLAGLQQTLASYGEGHGLTPCTALSRACIAPSGSGQGSGAVGRPQALVQAIDKRCCGSREVRARGKGFRRRSLRATNGAEM